MAAKADFAANPKTHPMPHQILCQSVLPPTAPDHLARPVVARAAKPEVTHMAAMILRRNRPRNAAFLGYWGGDWHGVF